MLNTLPPTALEFSTWDWSQIEPLFKELEARPLDEGNVDAWLRDWSRLMQFISEAEERLYVATTVNTADQAVAERYETFLEKIVEPYQEAQQRLKVKFLYSELEAEGFEIPLRNMRSEATLFREVNVPLFTEAQKLNQEYDRIVGAQTVMWEGEEKTLTQLAPLIQNNPNREIREKVWRLMAERRLQNRDSLNEIWVKLLKLRRQIAENAGEPDFRTYRWKAINRFDYTPEDTQRFRDAIEAVVVPAATRIYERHRKKLGVESVRPWDYPLYVPPLQPYEDQNDLIRRTSAMFHKVDPQFGDYFDTMEKEGLLDLFNYKGKGPGGYCDTFALVKRPFIFMNAVNMHDDVQTLLHEGGHAFHAFESAKLPYEHQLDYTAEVAELASMSMELLASPYLAKEDGGFYSAQDAARARIDHLEGIVLFWPYMAIVDAFQDWVYTHLDEALDPDKCDDKWVELSQRFRPGIDWTGLDEHLRMFWRRQLHIFQIPLYYIEYGLAQLGAVQVWRNSLKDHKGAVEAYRKALALGGTVTVPEMFAAAGVEFYPNESLLRECVELIEKTLADLEAVV